MPIRISATLSLVLLAQLASVSALAQQDTTAADTTMTVKELKQVTIVATKPIIRSAAGGMIMHVENSLLSKGSTAMEVLERSPGVLIDRRNNAISLNGRQGILLMVDGRPLRMPVEQAMAWLSGKSANDILRIELLDTPPAGYDAEGTGGVIHIITRRLSSQKNLTVAATGGYGLGEKLSGSLSISLPLGKISLHGSYTYSHDRSYSDMLVTSSQNMPVFGGPLSVVVHERTRSVRTSHNGAFGLDWKLHKTATLTYSGNIDVNSNRPRVVNTMQFFLPNDSALTFDGWVSGRNRWKNHGHSLYLQLEPGTRHTLNFGVDYLSFRNNHISNISSLLTDQHGQPVGDTGILFSPLQRSRAATDIHVFIAKADYAKRFSGKTSLSSGVKITRTGTSSRSAIESWIDNSWRTRNETFNEAGMGEVILAAYGSFAMKLDSGTSLNTGLRYEHSLTDITDHQSGEVKVSRRLGALFPTVQVTKKLEKGRELFFAYSSRVSRPAYNDLASFVQYSDPTAVYTGNTLLKPGISHVFKSGFSYKSHNVSLVLSHDKDLIVRYQLSESEQQKVLLIMPHNLSWQRGLMLQGTGNVRVNNWWTVNYQLSGSLKTFRTEHTKIPLTKNYFTHAFNMVHSLRLPRQFSAEVSGWYNANSYNGTIQVGGMGALNLGLKKELSKNRGTFQLSVTDLLTSARINNHYGSLTQEAYSIKNHVYIQPESSRVPIFRLSYTRSFGSSKPARNANADREAAAERVVD